MPRKICCLIWLVAALCGHGCHACNLTQTLYNDRTGLLHRCLNTTGTNEWHLNVACWVRALGSVTGGRLDLTVGSNYSLPDGRTVAECRGRYSTVALVYSLCFDRVGNASLVRWPGDVWTGEDGLRYTCTNASRATSSLYFRQGSRIVLFGCNSTASGRVVAPGSRELQGQGIVTECAFSGTETRDFQYLMTPVGDSKDYVQLSFGDEYPLEETKSPRKTILAMCSQRYGRQALVYNLCIENGTSGGAMRHPGTTWTGSDGVERECLPANPAVLVSAKIIVRACYDENSTLFASGSVRRQSVGWIGRCVFDKHHAVYGWFESVGCWPMAPFWSKVTNLSPDLRVGEEFCPNKICLAKCEKRQSSEQVSLVAKVCFENVGRGSIYRLPHENWTDDSGASRTCIPMADQTYRFGVGAETILGGCSNGSKVGSGGVVPPGGLSYGDDYIVYECAYKYSDREYSFNKVAGCWMHDAGGRRVTIAGGGAFKLPSGQAVATCRKKSHSDRLTFTVEVCFKGNQSSVLKWDNSSIAFPKEFLQTGSSALQCNNASNYSDGIHARWITYGCPSASGVEAPGAWEFSNDGVIRECAHNDREGALAAYAWVSPVGCWFRDHLNQTIAIPRFNAAYNHPTVGKKTAMCERRRFSDPKLRMFVCFSAANSRFYTQGDEWTDRDTGLARQCVWTSSHGVAVIVAGCWLKSPKASSSGNALDEALQQLLAGNGTVAFGSQNRILRCDFSEYNGKYEWKTSVACWHRVKGPLTVLHIGREVWLHGLLISKCQDTRNGATYVQHSCEHNGTWRGAMSTWGDANYRYKCIPASGDGHAITERTHCVTDDGAAIDESQTITGVHYLCMRVCGFLVFFRNPTPQQHHALFSLINNCHAGNMNIINNIG